MRKSDFTSGFNNEQAEVEAINELCTSLSISPERNFLFKRKQIQSHPNPYRQLNKIKSSISSYSVNKCTPIICSRCRNITSNRYPTDFVTEKEVDFVKKEKTLQKKAVQFSTSGQENDKVTFSSKSLAVAVQVLNNEIKDETWVGSDDPVIKPRLRRSQSSIIGNNEFWLPHLVPASNSSDQIRLETAEAIRETHLEQESKILERSPTNAYSADGFIKKAESTSDLEWRLVEFFNGIFKETIKKRATILHVVTLIGHELLTLTDEYIFECRCMNSGFDIINAIPLKDVERIMTDDNCTLVILQLCRAGTILEYREFVPGISERTESLISMVVYALSRANGNCVHLDVVRLPLLSLPTYKTLNSWYLEQGEDLIYCGYVLANCMSGASEYDFSGECFMIKTSDSQFYPVSLFLRNGQLISKCQGACESETCPHSLILELGVSLIVFREDHPRPNSVRLKIGCCEYVTLSCSSENSADRLAEMLYCCAQPNAEESMRHLSCILVTEFHLQLFQMTEHKTPTFGSPLLNVNIFNSENSSSLKCFIETEGTEAGDNQINQFHYRWELEFFSRQQKEHFLTTTAFISPTFGNVDWSD